MATLNSLCPLLSVIVPVYNTASYLLKCIDSILSQSYENIEVLLIDDGSNDGSGQLCDDYAAKDSRIKVIHQQNAGSGAARNRGLDVCNGEYVTFVDSDDIISRDAYAANIEILESEHSADIVQYAYCRLYDDGSTEKGVEQLQGGVISRVVDKYREAFVYGRLRSYMPNKIFRRKIFENLRFNETIHFEDRALLPDIIERSGWIIYSEYGMYYYRNRDGQITKSVDTRLFMESQICADLNIVKHAIRITELYDIALQRYSDCWYWCKRSGGLHYEEIAKCCPSVGVILKAHCSSGLKLKCLLARFCPKLLV